MKSSELRIGNFFDEINRKSRIHRPYGFVRKVGCISFFKVELYEVDKPFAQQIKPDMTDISNLSPIPLTEEWLLKFGFKRLNNAWNGPHRNDFSIWNPIGNPEFILNDTVLNPRTEYVHQLQNLYFALTGEELEIKS
jgi:hypothetical protein